MSHTAQRDPIGSSKHLLPIGVVFLAIGLAPVGFGGGCGGSGAGHGIITGSVTMCAPASCTATPPTNPSQQCTDGSVAGPACIKLTNGTCGWAVLSCPPPGSAGISGAAGGPGGQTVSGGPGGGGRAGGGVGVGGGGMAGGSGGVPATGGSSATGSGGTGGATDPGPIHGTGGNGTFAWTGNGQSESGPGYYEEDALTGSSSFVIAISSEPQTSGAACVLVGQFPAVPPPAGFYPMADFTMPQVDGTFVGKCSLVQPFAADDQSVSGQVAISEATPGYVEGSFTMHAARHISGTGGSSGDIIYSGAFSVGCRDGRSVSDPSCGARSATP